MVEKLRLCERLLSLSSSAAEEEASKGADDEGAASEEAASKEATSEGAADEGAADDTYKGSSADELEFSLALLCSGELVYGHGFVLF